MFFPASTMGSGIFDVQDQYNNIGYSDYPSIGNINGGTVYGSDGGGSWWDNWGDNIFGLISQGIGAWGRNPTQQIGSGNVGGLGGGYSPAAIQQQIAAQQQALALQNQQIRNQQGGTGVGSTVGGGIDGIVSWATQNPLPVFLGIGALFLLMKQPPGRR